ncbi:low molecular weight protein-tyrosine-phosphatase [Solitalea canadensis]|uniref:protein-tyrosine-phosphatase n=1 Tax=Solitalea canadensis (strain ATCC 29591 / DSM 3403 / JCM 21819 / LMG 8368 / NBRC 15130 / NCIMB 12057 / USAM 9D) TaxID=929556 RepID=H8KLR2_SOLCM|nr:low molecular weight protein-tyrosine-phosphatase [Solitalea canadensis]AFD09216.1 protein-tyrosine-phosphatase [Solitalea canadensis DSM 3403]
MKILMVCLGNICRSPMAEGIMRDLIRKNNLNWEVDSCGTGSWHIGEAPDKRAQRTAQSFGVDITSLRARQFSIADFNEFDRIYVMDTSNHQNVLKMAPDEQSRQKVDLLLNSCMPGENCEVADPWFDESLFIPVYKQIEQACQKIIESNR